MQNECKKGIISLRCGFVRCVGAYITWCHTFSPSKMWINGLANLQKPYCHFATQYNKEIPNDEIDMDFMNLNQAAHGDREHGFIAARLRMPRKVIAGYWQNPKVLNRIGSWMKSAVGVAVSRNLKVMRFGDNMREVAVTEGDKVEVQTKLGWQVNTWAVGDLVKVMNEVTEDEIDALMAEYESKYEINTPNVTAIRYQAREEIAMKKMMDAYGCQAFSNTFQDLYRPVHQFPPAAEHYLPLQGQSLVAGHVVFCGLDRRDFCGQFHQLHLGRRGQSSGSRFHLQHCDYRHDRRYLHGDLFLCVQNHFPGGKVILRGTGHRISERMTVSETQCCCLKGGLL